MNFDTSDQTSYLFKDSLNIPFTDPDKPWFQEPAGRSMVNSVDFNDLWTETQGLKNVQRDPTTVATTGSNPKATSTSLNPQPSGDATKFLLNDIVSIALYKDVVLTPPTSPDENNGGVFTCLAADGTTNLLQDIIGNKFNKEVILYKGTDRVYQLALSNSDAADNNINKWFLDTKSGGLYISNYDSTAEYKLTFYRYEGGKGYEGFVKVNIVEGNIGGTVDGTLKISKKLQAPQIDGSGSLYTTMDSFNNSQWENSTDPYYSEERSKEITHIKASADSNKLAFSIEDNENLKVINISTMETNDSTQILVDDFDNLIKNNINNSFEINSLDINGNGDEIIIKNKFQSDIQTKINQPVTEQEVRFPLYSENYNWKLDFEAYRKTPPPLSGATNAASWNMINVPVGKLTYVAKTSYDYSNKDSPDSSYFRTDFAPLQEALNYFNGQGFTPGKDFQVLEYQWTYEVTNVTSFPAGGYIYAYKIDQNASGNYDTYKANGSAPHAWSRNTEDWNLFPVCQGKGRVRAYETGDTEGQYLTRYTIDDSRITFVYNNIEDTFNTGVNSKQDDDIYIRLSISNNHLSDEEIQEIAPGSTKISRTIVDSEPYILGIHSSGYLWDLQKKNANFKQDVKDLYSGSPQKKAEALKNIRKNIKIDYSSDSYFFLQKGERYLSGTNWKFTRKMVKNQFGSSESLVDDDVPWRIRAAPTIGHNSTPSTTDTINPKLINSVKVTNDGYLIGFHNNYQTGGAGSDITNIGYYDKNIVWSSYGTTGSLKEIAYDVEIATLGKVIFNGRIPIYSGEMNGVTNPSDNKSGRGDDSRPHTVDGGGELPPTGPFQDNKADPPLIYSPLKADYDLISKNLTGGESTNGYTTYLSFGNYLTCFDIINKGNSWDNEQGDFTYYNNLTIDTNRNQSYHVVGNDNLGVIRYNLHKGGDNGGINITTSNPVLFENKSLKLQFRQYGHAEYRLVVVYKNETETVDKEKNYIFVASEDPFNQNWTLILEVGGAGRMANGNNDSQLFNYNRWDTHITNALGYNLYIQRGTEGDSSSKQFALFQNRQFIVPYVWSSQIGIPGRFPVYTFTLNERPKDDDTYRVCYINSLGISQLVPNTTGGYETINTQMAWTLDSADDYKWSSFAKKNYAYMAGMQGRTHIFTYVAANSQADGVNKNNAGKEMPLVTLFTSDGRRYTRTILDSNLSSFLHASAVTMNFLVKGFEPYFSNSSYFILNYGRKEDDGITNYVDYFGAPSYDIWIRKWVSSYLVKKSNSESKYTMSNLLLNENVEINKSLSTTDCIIQISKETISPSITIENEEYTRIVCLLDITGRSLFMRTRHKNDASKDHFTSLNLYEAGRPKNIIENGNVDQILMTSNSKYLLLRTSDSKIKFLNISSGKLHIDNYDDTNRISMSNTTAKPFGISPIYNDSLYIAVLGQLGSDNFINIKKIKFSNNQIESITDDSSITYTKSISNLDFTSRISRDFDYNNIQLYVTESDGTAIKIYQRKDAGEEGISYNLLTEKTGLGDALANDKFPKVTVGYKTYYLYKGNATSDKLNDGKILRIYKNNLILNENNGNVGIGTTSLDNNYKLSIYGGDLLINNGLDYGTIAGGNGDNKIYLGKSQNGVENTVEITSGQSTLMSINNTTGLSVTSSGVNKSTTDGIGPPGVHMGIGGDGNSGLVLVAEERGTQTYIDFNTEKSGYGDFMGRILHNPNGMHFYTNGEIRMYINSTGDVGIGTTTMDGKLSIQLSDTAHNGFDRLNMRDTKPVVELGRHDKVGTGYLRLHNNGQGTTGIFFNAAAAAQGSHSYINSGYLGIGTNDPKAKLEIAGSMPNSNAAITGVTYYISYAGTKATMSGDYTDKDLSQTRGFASSDAYPLAIKAHGLIYSTTYVGASDSRIKENIRDVSDNIALQKLRDISCVYYEYKDKIVRGSDSTIGFIAQQVREHVPMAVSIQQDIIPNEMRVIETPQWTEINDGSDNTFKLTIPDLEDVSGNTRYCFYMSNDISGNDEVKKEATTLENDPKSFIFDQKWSNVFLYGKEVDDFHALDKQKLFALNFSATQEIDRIQQKQILDISLNKIDIETTQLELVEARTKISTLENEVTVLKNQNSNLLTRIEALEKSINSST